MTPRTALSFFLAAVLFLTACSPMQRLPEDENTTADETWSYTFTDSVGSAITLTQKPQTVAVLLSSYAEIWTLAGGHVSVSIGESVERGFVSQDISLVDAGAGKTIDHELLLASQPDFVIGSADIPAQADACRMMAEAGIPAALFRVDTFPDYLSMLKICTDITGDKEAYARYGTAVEAEVTAILSAASKHTGDRKAILFIRAGSQYSSTKAKRAPDHFACTMLDELGAQNIADKAAVLLDTLSLEEILQRDPDYIFLTTMGNEDAAVSFINDLFAQDGWNSLRAVKNNAYCFLPKELFHFKPNARWGEAYTLLAEYLYPELSTNG